MAYEQLKSQSKIRISSFVPLPKSSFGEYEFAIMLGPKCTKVRILSVILCLLYVGPNIVQMNASQTTIVDGGTKRSMSLFEALFKARP